MVPEDIKRYIGQTVTIFTTSGGISGLGFKGVLLRVNPAFITLVKRLGTPPADHTGNTEGLVGISDRSSNGTDPAILTVNSVCDIPSDKIAAFSHYLA